LQAELQKESEEFAGEDQIYCKYIRASAFSPVFL